MCGSSIAVPPHLPMKNTKSISMDFVSFGAGMRSDSIPSRVLIASQPQEGNEASLDFRAEGLQGLSPYPLWREHELLTKRGEHHTSSLIALLHLNRSLTSLCQRSQKYHLLRKIYHMIIFFY